MDAKELHITCPSCGQHSAIQRKVDTDAGRVTVTDCVLCDRAKCPACQKALAGNAMACAHCRAFTWYRAGEGNLSPQPPTLAAAVTRAATALVLVASLAKVNHPELAEAKHELEQADKVVSHLSRQRRAA